MERVEREISALHEALAQHWGIAVFGVRHMWITLNNCIVENCQIVVAVAKYLTVDDIAFNPRVFDPACIHGVVAYIVVNPDISEISCFFDVD
eukprot:SAG31_NODE_17221_length_679_cov_0.653448_2_plen_91_part_01